MRTSNPQQPLNSRTAVSRKLLCMRSPAFSCALAVMAALWGTESLPAAPVDSQQKHTASTAIAPTNKSPHPSKRHADKHSPARAAQPAPGPVIPDSPKPPQWPANDKPTEASVVWNSQGLRIDASNSSLQQILKDVAAATGATVEGLHTDERVFGIYGPGTARDVLAKLLDGSGYNVLMIGDQGQGSPRQIVLSAQRGVGRAMQQTYGQYQIVFGAGDDPR